MEELIQKFNYHSHTTRCGHADFDMSDEMYVKEAIEAGFERIAFTDHMPFKDRFSCEIGTRMDIDEKADYFKSINYLKEKYKDKILIESGFEIEFDETQLEHIEKLRSEVSKIILGQHFIIDIFGKRYYWDEMKLNGIGKEEALDKYEKSISEGLKRGIVDILAHPDFFTRYDINFGKKEEEISRKICEDAIKYDVPLEINLNKIRMWRNKGYTDKSLIEYPSKNFWKIAAEYENKVLFGADVHVKKQYKEFEENCNIAKEILGNEIISGLKFVNEDLR